MEIRVLQYFLAVAREESITKAAESLHITQPSLSRQLKELELELGTKLLVRGSKKTTLTDDGMLLRKRAQEIMDLTQKTELELRQSNKNMGGDIWIGGGEFEGMRYIARTIHSLRQEYPNIRVHLISANAIDIFERLEKGLIDFGVGVNNIDQNKYESMWLPAIHTNGLLMRKGSPLAARTSITPDDLFGIPI
jgi:DNA-binding transcriptional LysR family regulator